jgi:hypothetical protein
MAAMNAKQKAITYIGLMVFVLAGLFPPWIKVTRILANTGMRILQEDPVGLSFILSPPIWDIAGHSAPHYFTNAKLDVSRLAIEWMLILAVTVGISWILHSNIATTPRSGILARSFAKKNLTGFIQRQWMLIGVTVLLFGLCAIGGLLTLPNWEPSYLQLPLNSHQDAQGIIHDQSSSYLSQMRNSPTTQKESNPWGHLTPRDIFTDPGFFNMSKEARRIVASKVWKEFSTYSQADQDATLDAPITYWQEYFKQTKPVNNP